MLYSIPLVYLFFGFNWIFYVCCTHLFFLVFFFFQAEDGIRDLTVTGVQTCALPIRTPNSLAPRARATWSEVPTQSLSKSTRVTRPTLSGIHCANFFAASTVSPP